MRKQTRVIADLSVCWLREGARYNSPKIKGYQSTATGVSLGCLVALVIEHFRSSLLPKKYIIAASIIAGGVALALYLYRILVGESVRIEAKFLNHFIIDADDKQVWVTDEKFENPIPLFDAAGYETVEINRDIVVLNLIGKPNVNFLRTLESSFDSVYEPNKYSDFIASLKIENVDLSKLCEIVIPQC